MTAYLQPGDKIHVACYLENEYDAPKVLEDLKAIYNQMGVAIFAFSGANNIKEPVVVSVIRTEKPPRPVPPDPDWKLE